GAVWWFVLREQVADTVATKTGPVGSGSVVATNPEGSGSAGSNSEIKQDGSQGSAAVEAPKGPMVDTVIASSVAKGSTVEIVGTDQKGPAPFTAKLEKDKTYKAIVTAPGFAPLEVELKGGQDKVTAKLELKPRVISVASEPSGADIYVDSINTRKTTPADITLTAAQSAKPKVRVSLRRSGFRPIDQTVEAKAFKDEETKMTAAVTAKLAQMQRPTGGGTSSGGTTGGGTTGGGTTGGGTTGSGATGGGAGSGSATTPTGGGTGSATTPTGGGTGSATTPTGGGTGSATTPSGGAGTGSAAKPPAGSGSAATPPTGGTGSAAKPPAGGLGGTATPNAASGEPEPSWSK
ncbi:MAG TPA: PEGA domain-containing protein, partial [Kofleriaceae bacterium]